jgi:hypothetical protein
MAMFITSARRLRYKPRRLALIAGLVCSISVPLHRQLKSPLEQLYLFAATTSQHTPQAYPALLYCVGSTKHLQLVREIVSQSDGTRFIYASGNAIFALHPHGAPTSAAIIHTDDPMRVDDVTFSPLDVAPAPSATVIAAPPGTPLVLLVPWITNLADPGHPPEHIQVTDARISSSPDGQASRVQFESWSDYAYLRREGAYGGPNYVPDVIGSVVGNDIAITFFGHSAVVDKLPPVLRGANTKVVPVIFAASAEYFIFTPQYSREETGSGKSGDSLPLYVHDRVNDRWNAIQSEGNSPTVRLFGAWLATIVGTWSINHEQPNPGRENERPEEKKTDLLPPTQTLYRSFVGHNMLLPGILTLQNLADGRKIRIETGQEDSEILKVKDDLVLYRVNDTIYQARIDGDHVKDTTVIVKDEDVPEVHWAFWSK